MLFSTKAEYGVRLMVELGRQPGSAPVALSAVAEAERLPLSYLEHLVAKLREAGLVTSVRGAHGGDPPGRPPPGDGKVDRVPAPEGPNAPMGSVHNMREGRGRLSDEAGRAPGPGTQTLWG